MSLFRLALLSLLTPDSIRLPKHQRPSLADSGASKSLVASAIPGAIAGFTLLELVVLMVTIGVLFAIAAPGLGGMLRRQELNNAFQEVYLTMQAAQNNAIKEKETWQASFREVTVDGATIIQYTVHQQGDVPSNWQNLDAGILLDQNETTLPSAPISGVGTYFMRFGATGETASQLGRITLAGEETGETKRCVIVSTILGAMRTAKDQAAPDASGRYCY